LSDPHSVVASLAFLNYTVIIELGSILKSVTLELLLAMRHLKQSNSAIKERREMDSQIRDEYEIMIQWSDV
jgi:hypothetical protein